MVLRKPLIRPVKTTTPPAKTGLLAPKAAAAPATKIVYANDPFAKAQEIRARQEQEAEQRKAKPFDFHMAVGEGGTKGVVLVLLDKANLNNPSNAMPFFTYMHRWGFDEGERHEDVCIQDSPEGCPLCKKLGRKGGYELELTCIDARYYTPKAGPNKGVTQTAPSKKLMTIKTGMIAPYERLYKQHKTFRGMVIRVFRDNAKGAATGTQVEFIKMMSEAELKAYIAKNKLKPEMLEPTDYAKAFARPTYAELAKRWDVDGAGSAAVGGQDLDDSIPF